MFLTKSEAAAFLTLSLRTLDRYRETGEGTSVLPDGGCHPVPAIRSHGMVMGAAPGLNSRPGPMTLWSSTVPKRGGPPDRLNPNRSMPS